MAKKIGGDPDWDLYEIEGTDNVSPETINKNTNNINSALTQLNTSTNRALTIDNLIADSDSIFIIKEWSWDISGQPLGGWTMTKDIGVAGYTPLALSHWGIGNGFSATLADINFVNQLDLNNANHKLYFAINKTSSSQDRFYPSILYIKNAKVY